MKSLKIVHCANFSESKFGSVFYSIDRKMSNGLIRNGHFVYDFSYREVAKNSTIFKSKKFGVKHVNNDLIKTVKNINPDLLLLGHSELIEDAALLKIKQLFPKIKIAMWWVDWIFNLKNIVSRLELIDNFFITTDPEELKKININESIIKKCSYLPNFCDNSIDTFKAFEQKNHKYDLLFIGRHDKKREVFINFLKETFNDLRVGLFGLDKSSIVNGSEYLDTISSSKIGINYSRNNDISLYSSDRIIHLIANGVLAFSPKIPNFDKIFTNDEIVYFEDNKDFEKKVRYYLNNPEQREKIAKNGWEKAHKYFSEKVIATNLVDKIFLNNKGEKCQK